MENPVEGSDQVVFYGVARSGTAGGDPDLAVNRGQVRVDPSISVKNRPIRLRGSIILKNIRLFSYIV